MFDLIEMLLLILNALIWALFKAISKVEQSSLVNYKWARWHLG